MGDVQIFWAYRCRGDVQIYRGIQMYKGLYMYRGHMGAYTFMGHMDVQGMYRCVGVIQTPPGI